IQDFGGYLDRAKFLSLPVSYDHGIRAGMLPGPHQDPFDRMLIAQAEIEKLFIVSNEKIFDQYGVRRVCEATHWAPSHSPAVFPRPLLIPTPSEAYIDLRVHLSI